METAEPEIRALFAAFSPLRLGAARAAFEVTDARQRNREIAAALVPLAVDAVLLGEDSVSALAQVAARPERTLDEVEHALEVLERAVAGVIGSGIADADQRAIDALLERLHAPPEESEPEVDAPTSIRGEAAVDESYWEPKLEPDLLASFLDESSERLDGLSDRLLALEGSSDAELVNAVFRDLHTLKGGSGFAGLKKLNRVAHAAEDLVGELREGKRGADRAVVDVLLQSLDVMRAILAKARARQRIEVEVLPLLQRLRHPTAGQGPLPAQPASVAAPPPAANTAQSGATLRIDFEKVDVLLNLVGEIVLARGRLEGATEIQGGSLREVDQLRRKLSGSITGAPQGRNPIAHLAEELQRNGRVLDETYADLEAGIGSLGLAVGQLRDHVMKLRMVPIARLFGKFQRTVRELGAKLGKQVTLEVAGAETELDKVLVERLEDPLMHLVRNAVDHGLEAPEVRLGQGKPREGTIKLSAAHSGGHIHVSISDDGAGMDPDRLRAKAVEKGLMTAQEARGLDDQQALEIIFRAGFSTAAKVSDVSGRGVGMDVVRDSIAKLKGTIHLTSKAGEGTKVELALPLTLAISQVLTARVAGELVAIPMDAVKSAQFLGPSLLEAVADGWCIREEDRLIPVLDLAKLLGFGNAQLIHDGGGTSAIIVEVGADRVALVVQQILARHEVVVKSLGPLLGATPCAAGATLHGDRVVLVVDLAAVIQRARQLAMAPTLPVRVDTSESRQAVPSGKRRVLVAEDSDILREAIRRALLAAGYDVAVAVDGVEALAIAKREQFDAVSSDVMMPRMDGIELVRALRADPAYRLTPIVMVTSKDSRVDSLRGIDAGADAYITKPADAQALVTTLEKLFARRRGKVDGGPEGGSPGSTPLPPGTVGGTL